MASRKTTFRRLGYAGNDIYGQHGFVDNELIENGRACKTQERRDAMEALLNQRVQDHFAALERLASLNDRPDVASVVLIMPTWHEAFNLPKNYGQQMLREGLETPTAQIGHHYLQMKLFE